ncbi:6157_t:CDS:1, partial [Ambispora gerdemannii]
RQNVDSSDHKTRRKCRAVQSLCTRHQASRLSALTAEMSGLGRDLGKV